MCLDLPKTAVFQHTVLTHRFSQLAITIFDACKLRLWLRIILYYLLEASLLLKSCTTRLQFLQTEYYLLLLYSYISKNKWTEKPNIIAGKTGSHYVSLQSFSLHQCGRKKGGGFWTLARIPIKGQFILHYLIDNIENTNIGGIK